MEQIDKVIKLFILITQLIGLTQCDETYNLTYDTKPLLTTTKTNKKLKYNESWMEVNDSTVLNCSLRVNRDQHVVWHRKYDKMGVHVLTIGSETFISDLRIRPIKQQFNPKNYQTPLNTFSSSSFDYNSNVYSTLGEDDIKFTWNLEIRRLKKEDSALYYCVLNSENAYGQIYKLNVLPHLHILNESEIKIDTSKLEEPRSKTIRLTCKYDEYLANPTDQIKWYFNKYRIKNTSNHHKKRLNTPSTHENHEDSNDKNEKHYHSNHFRIYHNASATRNESLSTLVIHDFSDNHNYGKYKCQYKGLVKAVKVSLMKNESSSRLLLKQTIYSLTGSSSTIIFSSGGLNLFKLLLALLLFLNI